MNGGEKKNEEREKKPRKTRERKIAKKKETIFDRYTLHIYVTYTWYTQETNRRDRHTRVYTYTQKEEEEKKRTYLQNEATRINM